MALGGRRMSDDVKAVEAPTPKFSPGDRVRKIKGSRWQGRVVGTYSTSLTPDGYAVESETEIGSVQIYPAAALERVEPIKDDIWPWRVYPIKDDS
jgi:hypothetical protein